VPCGYRRRRFTEKDQDPPEHSPSSWSFDDPVGVASGATGNPGILVYSARMAPTERPDVGYPMIFPSTTIVKAITVRSSV
jgi:hypothetical protein